MYYSQQINKLSILQRFIQDQTQIITATSVLGIGVDIPDIRYIIYIEMPRTLLDYIQENRYTGRDRQFSEAIIIQLYRPVKKNKPVQEYIDVVPEIGYRRYILDRYLNGPVNGYKRQYCRDENPEEIQYNRYDSEWQLLFRSAYSVYLTNSVYSAYSAYSVYLEYSEYTDRDFSSNKSIVFQVLLIPIAER